MTRFFFILLLSLLITVQAQDEGLYDPAPPANAAFVRLVHADPEAEALTVTIADTAYEALLFGETSPYRVVLQGQRSLNLGGRSVPFEVEAGRFYTVVLADEPLFLEDTLNTNRARTLLSFYNLTDLETLDLKTADGSTAVLTGVMPGTLSSITVNPIRVALAAFAGDTALHSFEAVQLERGAAYSVIVLGSADAPMVVWVQSETRTR